MWVYAIQLTQKREFPSELWTTINRQFFHGAMHQNPSLKKKVTTSLGRRILGEDGILQGTKPINNVCDIPTMSIGVQKEKGIHGAVFIEAQWIGG